MNNKELHNKQNKINKLLSESRIKIETNKKELNVILIDFVSEYNKIWNV